LLLGQLRLEDLACAEGGVLLLLVGRNGRVSLGVSGSLQLILVLDSLGSEGVLRILLEYVG
jgi:hypothetical protein